MVNDKDNPYRPCPCGSGKKYKFCCQPKDRETKAKHDDSPLLFFPKKTEDPAPLETPEDVIVGDLDKSQKLCAKGLKLMASQKYKAAIPVFKRAHAAAPFAYTPANNWALCLFITGKLDEATGVQKESLDLSPLENPFGMANLAAFLYIKGKEKEADAVINKAITMEMPSLDACVKVCETLARFKRHKDILRLADRSPYKKESDICFYTGVGAANLGDIKRARCDLLAIAFSHHRKDLALKYAGWLREKRKPDTVMEDWPYLAPYEICPLAVMEAAIKGDEQEWGSRKVAVDIAESMFNDHDLNGDDAAMGLLTSAKHPHASTLLWKILKGTFGTDALRMQAFQALQQRGEIKNNQEIEIYIRGRYTKAQATGSYLNPEIKYGGELPRPLDARYQKAVRMLQDRTVKWEKLDQEFAAIAREAPEFFPARHNRAYTLLNLERDDEAENLLRDIVAKHPDYLFSSALLLELFTLQSRKQEAEQLIESTAIPDETHPSALTTWQIALTQYYHNQEDYDAAEQHLSMAHQIAPEHPIVKRLWQSRHF